MAYDEKLTARIRKVIARRKGITAKHMFGGICFLLNGHICCGVHNDSLVLRVGPNALPSVFNMAHVNLFDIMGRPM